jgi:hypothetical protein
MKNSNRRGQARILAERRSLISREGIETIAMPNHARGPFQRKRDAISCPIPKLQGFKPPSHGLKELWSFGPGLGPPVDDAPPAHGIARAAVERY